MIALLVIGSPRFLAALGPSSSTEDTLRLERPDQPHRCGSDRCQEKLPSPGYETHPNHRPCRRRKQDECLYIQNEIQTCGYSSNPTEKHRSRELGSILPRVPAGYGETAFACGGIQFP